MIRIAALALLLVTGCAPAPPPSASKGSVVSLDYCADQMVLGLLPAHRIVGVSPEADSDLSFSAPRARGIARVRPALEDIVRLRPQYAVRLYGGAPNIDRQLTSLGITVIQLDFAGKLSNVPAELKRVGAALDAVPRANALVTKFLTDIATAKMRAEAKRPTLLYLTPGDVTTGADSFVGDVIATAGFRSVRSAPGWGSLPLETMVRRPPDAILKSFFDSPLYRQDHWSTAGHPRMRTIVAASPSVDVPGSAMACGNWLAGSAVTKLARLRAALPGET